MTSPFVMEKGRVAKYVPSTLHQVLKQTIV